MKGVAVSGGCAAKERYNAEIDRRLIQNKCGDKRGC